MESLNDLLLRQNVDIKELSVCHKFKFSYSLPSKPEGVNQNESEYQKNGSECRENESECQENESE